MPVLYDPSNSYLGTALSLTHSVVPAVLSRPTFWIFFILHLAVWTAYGKHELEFFKEAQEEDTSSSMSWHVVKVIVSMTTFFEVFYTNNVYTRYVKCYESMMELFGAELNLFMELRFHYTTKHLHWARLITRYAVAAVFVFLYDPESDDSVTEKEWGELVRLGLIREEEQQHLQLYGRRHCSIVLLHWSARVIQESGKTIGLTSNVIRCFLGQLLTVRQQTQLLLDTVRLPVPFQYFHLLNVMLVINLSIWAYGFGIMRSIFAPIGFFFAELIFCGLMELASQLADPFGVDEVDFPMEEILLAHFNNSVFLVEKCRPPDVKHPEALSLVNVADKCGARKPWSRNRMEESPGSSSPWSPAGRHCLSSDEDGEDDDDD